MQIVNSILKNSVEHKYTFWLLKTFLFQVIHFIQTVLIQLIQFSISIDFVYTQLNVKMSPPMTNMLCFGMLRTNEDNSS